AFDRAADLFGQRGKITAMTKFIAENSEEGDTVYFYESFDAQNNWFGGASLSPLFFARRKLPTPYVYSSFYLPDDERFRQRMVDAMYDGWMKSPPALVIFLPAKEDSFWFLIDPRIYRLVRENYHQVAQIDSFVIYKPNASQETTLSEPDERLP
ncbi:MAG TPA: hypothetical protein VLH60_05560, partial [Sedimentisphaerales bacterium]|nr:hypothetical protein [Sedimentisphaerales bacterium]